MPARRALLPLLLLAACSSDSKKSAPPASDTPPAATDGRPCTDDVPLPCPDGQIDACEKALTEEFPDASPTGTQMAVEQGRLGRLSRAGNHRCVPQ